MNSDQKQFLQQAALAAAKAGHVFALMAACEAALESGYGKSLLASGYNNLFGCKQHRHAIYQTHNLPTREFENGEWIVTEAAWIVYPDWPSCFADRMATLNRLAAVYPHYRAALEAADPENYVAEVSKTWSTDPERAAKVLGIYAQMNGQWDPPA
jgi:flagellum-specific peptidoglycan hydrolase FlgJ